ncbi:MAG TPA: YggT family protein [Thermoanaerobaculia bacterium]|nr:YggT family protein [Thermoanaerobaculia bacterium]
MEFVLILLGAVRIIIEVLQWVIFAWVILSWILFFLRESKFRWRHRQLYGTLEMLNDIFERMTRPFLRPIRRWLRRFDTAGIDWSPMVLVLILWIVNQMLSALAIRLATGRILSQ